MKKGGQSFFLLLIFFFLFYNRFFLNFAHIRFFFKFWNLIIFASLTRELFKIILFLGVKRYIFFSSSWNWKMSNFLARHKNEIKKVSCATLGELFGQKIALEVQFESTYIFQSWPVISVLYSQKFKVIYVFFLFCFFKVFFKGGRIIFF